MAALTAVASITSIDNTQKLIHVIGTIDLDGGDYAAGGVVVDLSGLDIPASEAPLFVHIESQPLVASKAIALFVYAWLGGSDMTDGQLQVFTGAAAQSGLAELANGAVPAGVSGDTVKFEAWFERL